MYVCIASMEILRCLACLAQMPLNERERGWKFAFDLYVCNEMLENVFIIECFHIHGVPKSEGTFYKWK